MLYTSIKLIVVACIICTVNSCCLILYNVPKEDYISGIINHATCDEPSSGSITQQWHSCFTNPAALNPIYSWSNGATTKDLPGIAPNYPEGYQCSVTYTMLGIPCPLVEKYEVRYIPQWQPQLPIVLIDYSADFETLYRNSSQPNTYGVICSNNLLAEDAIGYIEFTLLKSPTNAFSDAFIGFNDVSCPNDAGITNTSKFTGFRFSSYLGDITYSLYRNGQAIESRELGAETKFKIQIDNGVKWYIDGNPIDLEIYQTAIYSGHPTYVVQCKMIGERFTFKDVQTTFSCSSVTDYYAELTKELDGTCYSMTNAVKFKYREKYNNNEVSYVIYDWKRTPIVTSTTTPVSTTNRTTDANYHSISINSKLASDEVYIIEVKNPKGEVYRMRFRYKKVDFGRDLYTDFTVNPTGPSGPGTPIRPVRPVYIGPPNYDPTITVSAAPVSGFNGLIDIVNSMDYE